MRVLLCSLAVPWPSRPRLGIFHVHQAHALEALGSRVEFFAPGPGVPPWLGRLCGRLRDHAERPLAYASEGIAVHAPRTRFVFPPAVRFGLARLAPRTVLRWAERAMRAPLDATIAAFRPDVLLAHGIMPFGELVTRAAQRHGVRCAFIEHSADDVLRLRPTTRLGAAATACAQRAARVFVVGAPHRDWLTRTMGWTNVTLLPNGAIRAATASPPRPSTLDGRCVVLSVANYYRRKGFEELVDAFDTLAAERGDLDLHLVTAAPRSLRRRIARARHAPRITVHAPMSPRELLAWMAWADLFAMPSWRESFGLVYAEALAAGTPVLASSDSGFACEAELWAKDGHHPPAFIAPPHDVPALVATLRDALGDRERLRASAASGAQMVEERFTWERNAQTLLAALGEDLAQRSPRGAGDQGTRKVITSPATTSTA